MSGVEVLIADLDYFDASTKYTIDVRGLYPSGAWPNIAAMQTPSHDWHAQIPGYDFMPLRDR
jgi:hypothetical protein